MDSSIRSVGACISYELNKYRLHTIHLEHNSFDHKLLISENSLELRKWRLFSKIVTRIDILTPEQMAVKQEQTEMITRGGNIILYDEADMIKVSHTVLNSRILNHMKQPTLSSLKLKTRETPMKIFCEY